MKELEIGPDGVSSNSYTYNKHDINDNLIINQHSRYFQKNFKLKVNQGTKVRHVNIEVKQYLQKLNLSQHLYGGLEVP